MSSWHSYNKVYQIGHPAIDGIFSDDVLVEEKVDGSQFSMGIIDGELKCRSHHQDIVLDAHDGMFEIAVSVAKSLDLHPGWTYRAEYLSKPKHNIIAYNRTPKNNLIIFDINNDVENYLLRESKVSEVQRIGLEVVPMLYYGKIKSLDKMMSFMDTTSILGGSKIEGMVFKNYLSFGRDGKCLMGKYVSEKFKEQNKSEFRKANPTGGDIMHMLAQKYRSEARWEKAIIHMKEDGLFTGTVKDIGPLMKRIQVDVDEECAEEIKSALYKWAKPHIIRKCPAGFPEYFKAKLAENAFK